MCFLTRFRLHTPVCSTTNFLHVSFEILLFNFQGSMPVLRPSAAAALLVYHVSFRLSRGFSKFFSFFSNFFLPAPNTQKAPCHTRKCSAIIPPKNAFVKRFSKVFSDFFVFFKKSISFFLIICYNILYGIPSNHFAHDRIRKAFSPIYNKKEENREKKQKGTK